jgi:hypothetical protein
VGSGAEVCNVRCDQPVRSYGAWLGADSACGPGLAPVRVPRLHVRLMSVDAEYQQRLCRGGHIEVRLDMPGSGKSEISS